MADVDINKFRASVVRDGSKPSSPGFVVSEGQDPVDPSGSGQNHLPVTIAAAATGLAITESQVLGGAGTVGQYIRGDGSLADFPESSGGGSSISYYLNGSVSQGTIGGVAYKELNKVPVLGAGTDFTIAADGYIASFLTDAGDPNLLEIPGGNWTFETYFSASSGGGSPTFYVELYKYDGTTFTLIASNSTFPELIAFGTNIISYFSTLAVPTTALDLTDRLAIRYYVTHSGRTITLHTEDNHLCQIITTFTTGITALNGLTAQVQNFAVGTSGTDFAIASATATHTFNLPTASALNRGALSSADWSTFNNKTSNLGTVTSVGLSSATSGVTIGSTPVTTSGTITLAIATASGSQNGLLSSTDWTTFNSKQNALTNPVTGTGTTNYLPKFTGSTTIGNSNLINDASGNLGLGVTPSNFYAGSVSFEIGANGILWSEQASSIYNSMSIGSNFYYNSAGSLLYKNTGVASSIYTQFQGSHVWYSSPSGTAGNAISFTQAMTLTASGRLLLNTPTESTFTLDVNGTGRFMEDLNLDTSAANTQRGLIFRNAGSVSWQVYKSTVNDFRIYRQGSANDALVIATNDAATFSSSVTAGSFIRSGGTSIQYLMADGSVSTLSNPVTGTGTTNYLPKFTGASTIGNSQVFDNGTNVGIGTTAPQDKLTVKGATNYNLNLGLLGGYSGIYVYNDASSAYNHLRIDASPLLLNSYSGANVGIGTTSPISRLMVQDSANTYVGHFSGLNQTNGVAIGTNSLNVALIQGYTRTFSATNNIAMQADGGNVLIGTTTSGASKLRVVGLPTSATGLSAGDFWNDSGTLKIA
jgi:hypothetical protein